jgi:hypothetical protein
MKRLFALVLVLGLGAAALGTAAAHPDKKKPTRAICHRTSSKKKPYVLLRVSASQLRAHVAHPADIVPAPAEGCPRTLLTAAAGGRVFNVALTGESESPAGDPVGTGTATLHLRRGQGQMCFAFAVDNITLPAVGAHIHQAAQGASGPIVVGLVAPGSGGTSRGCVTASRSVVSAILGHPSAYYVNVHTTDFQAGAIRGQLVGTTTAAFGKIFTVQLTGANEGTTGDADGTGTATIRILREAEKVCFRLTAQNIILPSVGAHIHRAAAGTNGPIVIPLVAPNASGVSTGCATDVSGSLLDEILANPAGFYVNIHTTDHPGGAIRAQLA